MATTLDNFAELVDGFKAGVSEEKTAITTVEEAQRALVTVRVRQARRIAMLRKDDRAKSQAKCHAALDKAIALGSIKTYWWKAATQLEDAGRGLAPEAEVSQQDLDIITAVWAGEAERKREERADKPAGGGEDGDGDGETVGRPTGDKPKGGEETPMTFEGDIMSRLRKLLKTMQHVNSLDLADIPLPDDIAKLTELESVAKSLETEARVYVARCERLRQDGLDAEAAAEAEAEPSAEDLAEIEAAA